ncbi:unnamed protein product [Allacma fusca]|uniref:Integrase catalytic domain-containing protein n=1 Tax=Allacma fusca TaxID=39272 RepID=A0A8J2JNL9_9HEXA|nr:unnamed protein product [Allacma fusca]
MEALIAKRRLLKAKVSRIKSKVEHESSGSWNVDTATIYENKMAELWTEFNLLFDEIFAVCPEDEEEGHQGQYSEIADRIDEIQVALMNMVRRLRGNEQPIQRRQSREGTRNKVANVKLPKFDIPTFDGNLLEWTTFCDLFTTSVHNNATLGEAQKLQYLKSLMRGEAEMLLASYHISDVNYKEAWSALKKRYQNTRELIRSQLIRFMDMPVLKMESATDLRKLVDTASAVVRALKALNRPMGEECDLAIFMITSRLDSETNKFWETQIGREKIPNLTELLEFLDDRAAILNSSEFGKARSQNNHQPKQTNNIITKKANVHQTLANGCCPICPDENHLIYACKKFTEMKVEERREKAKQHALCFNCLRSNHFTQKYDSGVLRVGGRLSKARISVDKRNPIILPTSHVLTNLIITHEHLNTLHGGAQLVLANIHKRFWVVNGRNVVRLVIRKCAKCIRFRVQNPTQLMADLPAARVNPDRAFRKVGVDFTGPFTLRVHKARGNKNYKAYIAVFVCTSTKATHLELVSSLSSEAFISTLKRFIARRSLPSDIYSDCGRNFVGAHKELKRIFTSQQFNNEVGNYLASRTINWHFNPPGSPHFGGLWEAAIKSMKHHLNRALGVLVFNYGDMQTIIAQVEACLNSRPMTQLSTDPNDLSALTPGHFLIQRAVQYFWKRWSSEYLHRLQQRTKWTAVQPTLKIGDLVLLKDERLPTLKWKLARIVRSHPGTDGLSRVFTVKTIDGILKRPLSKLCPLPINTSD